jgi:hypothetical protein
MKFLSYYWLDKGIVLTVLLGGFGYIVMNVLIEIFLLRFILTVDICLGFYAVFSISYLF